MLVTKLVYNCTPDSLGRVSKADFVEAFEAEIYDRPWLRDASVEVTFNMALSSRLVSVAGDDEANDRFDDIAANASAAAERAFRYCLAPKDSYGCLVPASDLGADDDLALRQYENYCDRVQGVGD